MNANDAHCNRQQQQQQPIKKKKKRPTEWADTKCGNRTCRRFGSLTNFTHMKMFMCVIFFSSSFVVSVLCSVQKPSINNLRDNCSLYFYTYSCVWVFGRLVSRARVIVRPTCIFLRWIKASNGAWKFGAVNVLAVGGNRMHVSMHRPTFSIRTEQAPPSPSPSPPTKIIPSWGKILHVKATLAVFHK